MKYIFFIVSLLIPTPFFYAMETEKDIQSNQREKQSRISKETISLSKDLAIKTKKNLLTPIDKGLHTTVPGKIAHVTFDGESGNILATNIAIHRKPLADLVKYKKQLSLRSTVLNPVLEIFSPIVLKELKDKPSFIDLGLFNHHDQKYKELLKAIKENKALYCKYGPGALIYNMEKQPDPNNYKEISHYIIKNTRLQPQK
ncbi:MAG TPA: hypothetical protein VKU36_05025 [Candidatus Babeliales bacterium]|nr:hypothetical protein [Candidatus Babeliales bacterium]